MDTLSKQIARTQSRCAVTAWAVGLLAGLIQGYYGDAHLPLLVMSLLGSAFMGMAGAGGAMAGIFIRVLIAESRKRQSRWETEEVISGLVLGTLCGGFFGLVASLVLGYWDMAATGTVSGAFLGSLLCTLLSRQSDMLIQLLIVEKSPQMEQGEYQQREKLPPPEDD